MAKEEEVIDFSNMSNFNMDVFNEQFGKLKETTETTEQGKDPVDKSIDNKSNISDPLVEEAKKQAEAEAIAQAEAEEAAKKQTEESVAGKDEKDSDKGGESSSSPEIYSSFTDVLIDKGILSPLDADKEVKNADDLIEILNEELQNREFSDLNETQKSYLEGLRNGIPHERVTEQLSITNELNSITPELLALDTNVELRKEVIKQNFIKKGFAEGKAADYAQRSVDNGKDVEDALEATEDLKATVRKEYEDELNANKQAALKAQEESKKALENLQKTVKGITEIIPGVKVTDVVKDKLYKQMTMPVARDAQGNNISAIHQKRMEDPVDFELKLNYLFHITEGFTNFDKVAKVAKSKAIQTLDETLKSGFSTVGAGSNDPGNLEDTGNSFKNLGEIL